VGLSHPVEEEMETGVVSLLLSLVPFELSTSFSTFFLPTDHPLSNSISELPVSFACFLPDEKFLFSRVRGWLYFLEFGHVKVFSSSVKPLRSSA